MSLFIAPAVRSLSVISIATGLLLAGCGDGTSTIPITVVPVPAIAVVPVVPVVPVIAALTLSSSTPANDATSVARSIAPQLVFSAGLNSATATAANVTLTRTGGSATLSLSVAGTQLTATPSQSLLPLTAYTLRAGTGLTGTGGETLASAQSVSFTTADGAWRTAQLIETDNAGNAETPQIAFDTSGNALAVWQQSNGTRINIWSNRYVVGTGWGTAQLIETDNTSNAQAPQIAIDASGNALAVWFQADGTRNNIWSNRYVAGTGWGTAQLIETDNAGSAQDPQIAFDTSGNALAVWRQSDGTRINIWSNRYVAGTGWGTAQLIETDNAGSALVPQIAIDASGNALAVWMQSDGTRYNIWSNRYVAGIGWGTAQLIETNNASDAFSPEIALDASGNALAVWQQSDGTRYNIWSNRYVAGIGWGTAQLIETDNAGHANLPQIALDASGNALAVWMQSDGTRNSIWSNRYGAGTGWGTAQLIETDNAGHAQNPQIAIDASGNALAGWFQFDGTRFNIRFNRYVAGAGWGTAQLIETDNASDAQNPQIAIDGSGNALAIWQQSNGTRDSIWSNRFD